MIYVLSLPEPCQPAIKPHYYEDLLLREMGQSLPVPPHVALHIWHLNEGDRERESNASDAARPDIPR